MKRIFYTLLTAVIIFNCTSLGQKYGYNFDYAQFRNDSISNAVEFYYSFNQSSFKTQNGTILALMQVVLKDSLGKDMLYAKKYLITQNVSDSVKGSVLGMFTIPITKGYYKIEIVIKDSLDKQVADTIRENLNIIPLVTANMSISDLQLSTNILEDKSKEGSIFYKNGFEVTPLPSSVYNAEISPVLFYYAELYNLNIVQHEKPYKLYINVFNSKGKPVFSKNKELTHKLESRVEVGFIPIYKLANDTYTISLTMIDSVTNYGISSSKKFFLYNPKVKQETYQGSGNITALSSEFAGMNEEELDDVFEKSKYKATRTEVDKYKSLKGETAKKEFVFNFWKSRDAEPETPENETYKSYLSMIEIANARYSTNSKQGWRSDRGRVYLSYGEPSEIERFPNQVDTKPYEIWHYNDIEGGVVFVFADLSGFSEYIILHSTKRGELRDDNWTRRIESF